MTAIDSILRELDQEAATTRRVLERVPEDKLTWKPHPKSMSLGRLAMHVAEINGSISEMSLADSFDFGSGRRGVDATSRAELLEVFEKGLARAKEIVAQTDEARARAEWSFMMGEKKMGSMPRSALFRSIMMNHLYHHRGQLSVYLRLLDVPVPSIYGPSADENPLKAALE